MKYKNIFLIFLIIILSGCSASYNIEIEDDTIKEKLEINNIDINKFNKLNLPIDYECDDQKVFEKKVKGVEYYNIDTKNNNAYIYYKFNKNNYNTSMLFKNCYRNTTYSKDYHEILISTSNSFLCYESYEELENITIHIKSRHKLIETNADKIEGNNYYWYINKDNKDNKPIKIRLDNKKKNRNLLEIINETKYGMPIVLISAILFILLIIFLLKKKGDRRNKI